MAKNPLDSGMDHVGQIDGEHGHEHAPAREVLSGAGLRCTRQRELLFDALRASHRHPTAEELFATVRRDESSMSLATVYNALDAFADAGLIRRIPSHVGNGPSRYDADIDPHAHVSTLDGRIVDLSDEVSERILGAIPADLLARVEAETGLRIAQVRVELLAERTPANG